MNRVLRSGIMYFFSALNAGFVVFDAYKMSTYAHEGKMLWAVAQTVGAVVNVAAGYFCFTQANKIRKEV